MKRRKRDNEGDGAASQFSQLRRLIAHETIHALNENYARGIPDFALSQVASSTVENMKQHLKRHINQMSADPSKQRQMLAAANLVLEELEVDVKQLLENKLLDFLRKT